MNEENCLKQGGHCWIDTTIRDIVLLTFPPQYPPETRMCKHCQKKEVLKVVHKEEWRRIHEQ